jgi:hypothetical protein
MSDYIKAGHYSTRSNFVHTAKKHFKCWYHSEGSWDEGDSESIRMTVKWLLEEDRFTCSREFIHVRFCPPFPDTSNILIAFI